MVDDTASEQERLTACERAFEAGDFAHLRKLTQALERSSDSAMATRAREVSARVSVDHVSLGVLACSLFFFLLVARHYVF